jgi:uncharacterized membrane protein YdbT with pleckstrin-like domain
VRALKLSDNPLLRVLAVIVLIAAGIRLTFELLDPVWPYLLAVLIGLAVIKASSWWRGRW